MATALWYPSKWPVKRSVILPTPFTQHPFLANAQWSSHYERKLFSKPSHPMQLSLRLESFTASCTSSWFLHRSGDAVEILISSPHSHVQNLRQPRHSTDFSSNSHWNLKNDSCTQEHKEEAVHFWTHFKSQAILNVLKSRIDNTSRSPSPLWTLSLGRLFSHYSHFFKEFQRITKFYTPWVLS